MVKMDLSDIEKYAVNRETFEVNNESRERIQASFRFLEEFSSDKIIYGINTGFGPMAQFKIDDNRLNELQYN